MRFGIRELIFFIVLMAVPISSFFFVFKPRNELINQLKEMSEISSDEISSTVEAGVVDDDNPTSLEENHNHNTAHRNHSSFETSRFPALSVVINPARK